MKALFLGAYKLLVLIISFGLFFSILYLRDNFSVVSFLFSLIFLSFICFFFEGKRGNFLEGFNPEGIFPDTNVSYKVYYILLSYIFLIYVYLFYLLQLLNYNFLTKLDVSTPVDPFKSAFVR